jgi:hypothetical protein
MVYIEHAQVRWDMAGSPEFVAKVSRALRVSQELLDREKDPAKRARIARLVQEVAARFVAPRTANP